MSAPLKELMSRLIDLVDEHGHQWKKIAPILASEGYRNAQGKLYSDNYLRYKMKRRETAGQKKRSAPSEGGKPSGASEPDISELARAVIALLKQKGLFESSIKELMGNLESTAPAPKHEMPPQPKRVTDRSWEKLAGTCDCQLVERFHAERRKLRLSGSQMLDYVLWNFFDKPRLSFQSERSEESEHREDDS